MNEINKEFKKKEAGIAWPKLGNPKLLTVHREWVHDYDMCKRTYLTFSSVLMTGHKFKA